MPLQAIIGPTIILAGVGAIYCLIERLWPAIPGQPRWRRGVVTDLGYFYVNSFASRFITGLVAAAVVLSIAFIFGLSIGLDDIGASATRDTFITRLPLWLQFMLFIVPVDFAGYWTHRTFHRQPVLWRYHAVHHSSKQLDWLSGARVHPLNDALQNALPAIPILLLGFSIASFSALLMAYGLVAIIVHANVGWTWGPLRYAIISPVYHRWHHTTEREGIDKNFAGLFPWIDLLFGTFYMPKGVQPTEFGVLNDPVPQELLRQLVYPFRRRKREERAA